MRHRQTIATEHSEWQIQVTDDGSRTLISSSRPVAFHSASGAMTETDHVYLRNGDVTSRVTAGIPTAVLEIGLGTGMGLLMTLDAARTAGTAMRYTALENQWLAASLLRQLSPWQWVTHRDLASEYLQWRDSLPACVTEGAYHWRPDEKTCVTVEVGDARAWVPQPDEIYDAVFFDPFAPDHNRELWQTEFFKTMRESLSPGGKLVSYCVSRTVRDRLRTAGFEVRTVRGPQGGKRDVLVAQV